MKMFYYRVESYIIASEVLIPALGEAMTTIPADSKGTILGKSLGLTGMRDLMPTSHQGEPIKGLMQLFLNPMETNQALINVDCLQSIGMLKSLSGALRLNILGLGDVGSHLLIGLKLMGGDVLESIGIFDLNPKQIQRYCLEVNQIYTETFGNDVEIKGIDQANLFDCDVFVFTASAFVPPVNVVDQDVRMAQFEANSKIVQLYAKQAREKGFKGIFAVVSDPVDLLCTVVYETSNRNEQGVWDGQGLSNQQVFGFGLGVMHARAKYYAKKHSEYAAYLEEGAIFGPHGKELVVVQSTDHYDENLSLRLTQLTTEANIRVRELGFKPFIAPAYSSAALSLLAFLKGETAHVASYLDGVFFGAKCKRTSFGIQYHQIPYHAMIHERLKKTKEALEKAYRERQL
jgi:malate/lactate dehydrogenase